MSDFQTDARCDVEVIKKQKYITDFRNWIKILLFCNTWYLIRIGAFAVAGQGIFY